MEATTIRRLILLLPLGILVFLRDAQAQTEPCLSKDAIFLPQDGTCLVPITNAKDWVQAQATCEAGGGDLYRLTNDGRLPVTARLSACLANLVSPLHTRSTDFWIGAISKWSRHWLWVNGSALNPLVYTTTDRGAFENSLSVFQVCDRYLSVESCMETCYADAAAYSILHMNHPDQHLCCLCSFRMVDSKVRPTQADARFNVSSSDYQIVASKEGRSVAILMSSTKNNPKTDTLCATVDTETLSSRKLTSQNCFTKAPFLCDLGSNTVLQCNTELQACQEPSCRFGVRGRCVQRDNRPLTWLQARAECKRAGGDLWNVYKHDDLHQVSQYFSQKTAYWIGATIYTWLFKPESIVFGTKAPDYQMVRCGHMSWVNDQWEWSNTRCDQDKAYICQYEQTIHTVSNSKETVICPWTSPVTPVIPPGPVTTDSAITTTTATSVVAASVGHPIIPIIAACIAAFLILMCAIGMLLGRQRRKWLKKKDQRDTQHYVWPVLSAPSYISPDHVSDRGFDTLSTAHTHTGMHSDAGSVFAPATFPFSDATYAHAHKNGGHSSSRSGLKRTMSLDHLGGDRLVHTLPHHRYYTALSERGAGTSHSSHRGQNGGVVSHGLAGTGTSGGDTSRLRTSSVDERFMSASYSPHNPHPREYMTLAAYMNINDENDPSNRSRTQKPEVALVTSDVDLNFTVNHAYTRDRHPLSGHGSEKSSVRGFEGLVDLPSASTVQIPTRATHETAVDP